MSGNVAVKFKTFWSLYNWDFSDYEAMIRGSTHYMNTFSGVIPAKYTVLLYCNHASANELGKL